MPSVLSPMKCATCGEVTIFEIVAPVAGEKKSFEFMCPNGHPATNSKGGAEIVDLKNYDASKLKRVKV